MKKLKAIFGVICLCAPCFLLAAEVSIPPEVKEAQKAVFKLRLKTAQGSGFFFKNESTFVTSFHMLHHLSLNFPGHKLEDISFFQNRQNKKGIKIKKLRYFSLIHDFAILEVTGYEGPVLDSASSDTMEEALQAVQKSGDLAQKNHPIYALGYPGGKFKSIRGFHIETDFYTSRVHNVVNGYNLHGISGGPILNSRAKVIGMSLANEKTLTKNRPLKNLVISYLLYPFAKQGWASSHLHLINNISSVIQSFDPKTFFSFLDGIDIKYVLKHLRSDINYTDHFFKLHFLSKAQLFDETRHFDAFKTQDSQFLYHAGDFLNELIISEAKLLDANKTQDLMFLFRTRDFLNNLIIREMEKSTEGRTKQKRAIVLSMWEASAGFGYAEAQFNLGRWILASGMNERGLELITQAAKQGHPHAQMFLAFRNKNMLKDFDFSKEEAYWLNKVADWGHPYAQVALSGALLSGTKNIPQNVDEGIKRLYLAHEQDHPFATTVLSLLLLLGYESVPPDRSKSLQLIDQLMERTGLSFKAPFRELAKKAKSFRENLQCPSIFK